MCLSFSRPCFFYFLFKFFTLFFLLLSFLPPPTLWAATQSLDKIVEHKHFFLPTVTGKNSLGTGMLSASLPAYLNIYAVPPSSCQADVLHVSLLPRTIPWFHTSFCMPFFYRIVALEITTDNYYCSYTGWQRSVASSHGIFITNPINIWVMVSRIWGIVPSHPSGQIFTNHPHLSFQM